MSALQSSVDGSENAKTTKAIDQKHGSHLKAPGRLVQIIDEGAPHMALPRHSSGLAESVQPSCLMEGPSVTDTSVKPPIGSPSWTLPGIPSLDGTSEAPSRSLSESPPPEEASREISGSLLSEASPKTSLESRPLLPAPNPQPPLVLPPPQFPAPGTMEDFWDPEPPEGWEPMDEVVQFDSPATLAVRYSPSLLHAEYQNFGPGPPFQETQGYDGYPSYNDYSGCDDYSERPQLDSGFVHHENFENTQPVVHSLDTDDRQLRSQRAAARANRNQPDTDVLSGMPVRQYVEAAVVVNSAPPKAARGKPKKDTIWTEHPMPKGSELYPTHSRLLLRQARMPYIPPEDRDEPEEGDEDAEGEQDDAFTVKKWTLVPQGQERPEKKLLAERPKSLPPLYGVTPGAPVMRKVKVKRLDSQGNENFFDVLVPEGVTLEGEVAPSEAPAVATEPVAPGTVVEGVGVANEEGIVVAEAATPQPNRRKPPPPPKRKKHGPGRGKKKKVMLEAPNAEGVMEVTEAATPSRNGDDGDDDDEDGDDDGKEDGELSSDMGTPTPDPGGVGLPEPPRSVPTIVTPTSVPPTSAPAVVIAEASQETQPVGESDITNTSTPMDVEASLPDETITSEEPVAAPTITTTENFETEPAAALEKDPTPPAASGIPLEPTATTTEKTVEVLPDAVSAAAADRPAPDLPSISSLVAQVEPDINATDSTLPPALDAKPTEAPAEPVLAPSNASGQEDPEPVPTIVSKPPEPVVAQAAEVMKSEPAPIDAPVLPSADEMVVDSKPEDTKVEEVPQGAQVATVPMDQPPVSSIPVQELQPGETKTEETEATIAAAEVPNTQEIPPAEPAEPIQPAAPAVPEIPSTLDPPVEAPKSEEPAAEATKPQQEEEAKAEVVKAEDSIPASAEPIAEVAPVTATEEDATAPPKEEAKVAAPEAAEPEKKEGENGGTDLLGSLEQSLG